MQLHHAGSDLTKCDLTKSLPGETSYKMALVGGGEKEDVEVRDMSDHVD